MIEDRYTQKQVKTRIEYFAELNYDEKTYTLPDAAFRVIGEIPFTGQGEKNRK